MPFFHGTNAALQVGDELVAGRTSNYQDGRTMNHVYCAAVRETAVWGAELAAALRGDRSGVLASADVAEAQGAADAVAFDLESAAVLAAAARAGIPAACLVAIEGAVDPDDVAARLGRAAMAAIAPVRTRP